MMLVMTVLTVSLTVLTVPLTVLTVPLTVLTVPLTVLTICHPGHHHLPHIRLADAVQWWSRVESLLIFDAA
jgi:hypothetical protein